MTKQSTSAQLISYLVDNMNKAGYRGNFEQVLASKLSNNMTTEERAGHVIVRDGLQSKNHGAVCSIKYNCIADRLEVKFF